jgi:hypothetical protein
LNNYFQTIHQLGEIPIAAIDDGLRCGAQNPRRSNSSGNAEKGFRSFSMTTIRVMKRRRIVKYYEEWKWVKPTNPGVPVWSHDGVVCTGESYQQVVKLPFFRGASIKDPQKLLNSSLEGNVRRAIDFREAEKIDEASFKQLIRAAVAANSAALAQRAARKK